MTDIFALASRNKFRFATPQGQLTVEDLWDLPLTSTRGDRANLDALAIALDKELKESGTVVSFVKKETKTNEVAQAKFDIVLHIIGVKQAEATAQSEAQARKEQKERIKEILAKKKDAALEGMDENELQKLLASL